MNEEKRIHFLGHETYQKGWGREVWIVNRPEYCLKLLQFDDGGEFSFHYHLIKTETWYVSSGRFHLIYHDLKTGEKLQTGLGEGDIVHVPVGVPHKLIAIGKAEIIEVSTQHYEEDSYRIAQGDSQQH